MSELLNRLKNSINKQILNKVDKALMEQMKFVPLSVKDKFLFVAIASASDKDAINDKLRQIFPYQIKLMQVPDADLEQLIVELFKNNGGDASSSSSSVQGKLG